MHIAISSSWESRLENLLEPYLDPASHSTGQPQGVSICRSEMKRPKSGQDRRDAAVFHCNVGQVLLLAWGSGGKYCQTKSNAQRRTQTSCPPKEWGQYFRKRHMGILEVGGQEGRKEGIEPALILLTQLSGRALLHQVVLTQESLTVLPEKPCWGSILKLLWWSCLAINQGERWIKVAKVCEILVLCFVTCTC